MAKLYFRYSSMGAGKSLDVLKTAYNYEENGEKILLFTSVIDDRYDIGYITSRVGLKKEALIIKKETNIFDILKNSENIKSVIIDESQFLTKDQVFQLSDIVDILDIPVLCYGIRSDFKLEPFEGSKYLMTISDTIEEIKTICSICKEKKAIVNARIDEKGNILKNGEQIQIGGNESYKPMCRKCYKKKKNK